ncbi:MAG: hypothetical protein IT162_06725 [Bryobacterales bacterium]|nr:hypothetical protein [Bryobacterales bacterium]
MNRKTAGLLAVFALTVSTAAPVLAEDAHGGAIPSRLSFFEPLEFLDVHYEGNSQVAASWGKLVVDGTAGVKFVPDNGQVTVVPFADIKAVVYNRVVKPRKKNANAKWYQKPLDKVRTVDVLRTITLETASGKPAVFRVDEESYPGILRMLETTTGLQAKRMSKL